VARDHLMIGDAAPGTGKRSAGRFEFDNGTLTLTEAGTQASRRQIHVLDRAPETVGWKPLELPARSSTRCSVGENTRLKRSLPDPVFSGIHGIGKRVLGREILCIRGAAQSVTLTLRLTSDGGHAVV